MLDQGGRAGNYLEASASSMYVYAFCKGVRVGPDPAARVDANRRVDAFLRDELAR